MQMPDLTVVIPAKKGIAFLPMSLAHLEIQTHPAARFEIVVVEYGDDGSTGNLLERYSAGAPVRTRCLRLPQGDIASARNRGAREAKGRWLLFLDEELLAGPGLVAAHVKGQESRGGQAVVLGRVQTHPQVSEKIFTKRFRLPAHVTVSAPPFVAWDFSNLSLPREAYFAHGGLEERLGLDGLQELALAWRLQRAGMRCLQVPEATAYAWRPTRLHDERRRHYLNGYSLSKLIEHEESDELARPFPVRRSAGRAALDWLVQPLYRRLCDPLTEGSRAFAALYPRILEYELYCGFRDARRNRPPAFVETRGERTREAEPSDA